ncbi:hypothetical protein [Paenibacillus silvisoli]|uniref:hypothetical protein n=1 Tax=Paenibacillus silvisoli TaxID=3110539 RepID=UPI0028055C68|nr:hypothetical protein [Paenibacillus silvisoli]
MKPTMDPLLQEHKKETAAGYLSIALAIVVSVIGIFNWLALRGLVISLLGYYEVDPFAWQAIDYSMFISLGIGWLAYVYYSQFHFKKRALAGRVWSSFSAFVAVQAWLLFGCGLPYFILGGLENPPSDAWLLLVSEGSGALVLTIVSVWLGKNRAAAVDR